MIESDEAGGRTPETGSSDDALGFTSEPGAKSPEKYNTRYLTSNLQHDRRNSQLVLLAIVTAAILGAVGWFLLMPLEGSPVGREESLNTTKEAPAKVEESADTKQPVAPEKNP